ncbi:MAG: nitroreductase family protein [Acidimicrobiales bacterium]
MIGRIDRLAGPAMLRFVGNDFGSLLLLHPLLPGRWSPTSFNADDKLSDREFDALLEATRWAPSAGDSQPWGVIVARRGDTHGPGGEGGVSGQRPAHLVAGDLTGREFHMAATTLAVPRESIVDRRLTSRRRRRLCGVARPQLRSWRASWSRAASMRARAFSSSSGSR